ncbi:phage tail spike protein [Streptococcus suis]
MIYLFDKDEKLIKIVRKSAVKTALQKYALTTERYVSDRLTVELKGLNADELEQVEYMAIQTMEDAHTFHYFYVAQKSSDELTTLIGVQSGIEELRKSPVYDKRPQNAFARDVITDLLAGTNWQARFVGETTPHSTNFYYTSVFDALKKVCEVWDLEMQFFVEMNGNRIGGRYIDFKRRIGEAVGKRVVYGHNALQILQEVERTNIFTALIGRGKGEETGAGYGRKITFEDVVWSRAQGKPVDKPKGQKYLELPLMTRQYGIKNADGSMRPKIGFVDFSEEENPEILIERTYKALIDAARPQLTLKTSSVYLKGVKIGDTIRVVRHDKKLDYDTRIFEITFNRLNNQSSDIKLGDRIGESNEAKVQTIADKAVEQFITNEFSTFVQNLPNHLPSADGFNNNWYGAEDPTVQYPGKVLINDIWFKPDPEHEGHKIMLRWTGEVWEEILRTYESESLRDRIAEEIAQVNQSMQAQSEEHDRQVADILSKTQSVEELANQAKTDAASAITTALQSKDEAIADARAQFATVSQALNTAKTELQTAIASADQKARDSQASATALRNDLNLQASKILEQAQAQTDLTNRVTTVETLADGTRSTVAELSRTMQEATQNITSVISRTRTVEDTLSQTRTQYETLTQTVNAQTGQIDSINRKTADLQSGIDGVTERFENLQVGGINLLTDTDEETVYISKNSTAMEFLRSPYDLAKVFDKHGLVTYTLSLDLKAEKDGVVRVYMQNGSGSRYGGLHANIGVTTEWKRYHVTFTPTEGNMELSESFLAFYGVYGTGVAPYARKFKLEKGTVPTDWSPAEEDLRSEIATYKRTAEESRAELSRQIQLADGKAVEAKTFAQQTATQLTTRLSSLETYKDAEGARASQYLTASREETARQLEAERASISANYVAKSTYTEDVRGTTQRLNEIKTTADIAKQNLATYQETVDRKLTELTSSTQTLDGKINTASAKVDTVAGQIRTELTRVEGKIPSDLGGRNYILKSDVYATSGSRYFDTSPEFIDYAYSGKYVTISLDIKGENLVPDSRGLSRIGCELRLNLSDGKVLYLQCQKIVSGTQPRERISVTRKIPEGVSVVSANKVNMYVQVGGTALAGRPKFELSSIPTDWSPAPEDINSELSSTKTLITQTAEGQTQLSNRLTTTQDKVSTAETKISQLISDVSSKVSQTDYNTLTGRVDSAETAITQNATEISRRLTSTQVESAINAKGYQTKAQVDNNITGRGYITSSALQPYALAATVQNLVQETADSFSRTISETKALIPTEIGTNNLFILSGSTKGIYKSNLHQDVKSLRYAYGPKILIDSQSTYTLQSWSDILNDFSWLGYSQLDSNGVQIPNTYVTIYPARLQKYYRRNIITHNSAKYIQFSFSDDVFGDTPNLKIKFEKGMIATDWSPAPEDLATVTALHNVTDTVDSHTRTIGAVGTAGSILDNVSKVTQTAAGLVQEVSGSNGLKTQVSTLAGSYAIQNLTNSGTVLNQLNLNKDGSVKIDGKLVQITGTTYIQDGVITSAKIAGLDAGKITTGTLDAERIKASSIDGSKLVFDQAFFTGLTANEAYLKQLFAKDAFITQVQAVTLSADKISGGILSAMNDAMQMDLNNANISFNTNATINFNSANNALVRRRGTHTAFLHFNDVASSADANAGGVYAGLGVTSSGDGIDSQSSGRFSGIRIFRSAIGNNHVATLDHVELYGDTIYFKDGFDGSRGYVFKTSKTVNQTIDMNLYINAIKAIAHCLNHLRSNNWDWKLPNLRNAISGLMDSYINKTDFYNKL